MAPSTLAEGEAGYQCITQLGEAQVACGSRVGPGQQPSSTPQHPPMGARSQNSAPSPPYSSVGAGSQKPPPQPPNESRKSEPHLPVPCIPNMQGFFSRSCAPQPGTPLQVYPPGSQIHLGSVEALRFGWGSGLLCLSVSPEPGRGPSTRSRGPSPDSSLETLCLPWGLRQR